MTKPPTRVTVAVAAIFLLSPSIAGACSFAPSPNFTEVTRTFTVAVRFEDKPLASANVTLHPIGDAQPVKLVTNATDGTTQLKNILPGRYHVHVDYLGVSSAWEQIEVRDSASSGAKPRLEYRWGEPETTVRRFAGKMTSEESRPNSPRRIVNHVLKRIAGWRLEGPIAGAHIRLQHPTNGRVYNGVSDNRGEFALPGVPNGTYVMEVLRGENLDISSTFVVRVSPTATKDSLQLKEAQPATSCSGPSFRFVP